jgi:hypothetical protein
MTTIVSDTFFVVPEMATAWASLSPKRRSVLTKEDPEKAKVVNTAAIFLARDFRPGAKMACVVCGGSFTVATNMVPYEIFVAPAVIGDENVVGCVGSICRRCAALSIDEKSDKALKRIATPVQTGAA